jgi:predicted transcriptional regulator
MTIELSDQERQELSEVARLTGKSEDQLVREALNQLVTKFRNGDHLASMRKGRGIWKDRADLPSFAELRAESNRH